MKLIKDTNYPKETPIVTTSYLSPDEYSLSNNYPNPFNPTTTIKYGLPEKADIEVTIYNLQGKRVKTLVNKTQDAGYHKVKWHAGNLANGVYFYRIKADDFRDVKKCVFMK